MNRKRKSNGQPSGQPSAKRQSVRTIPRPPQFESTYRTVHRVRYVTTNGGGNISFTRANLLNQLVMNKASGVNNGRILSGVKLDKIEMWCFSSSSTANYSVCSVEWTSTYGPSKVVSDSSIALEPGYVHSSPPAQSLASFWSISGSNESDIIMLLNYPGNCIIDITYSLIVQNGETPVNVVTTNSGVAGQVYQLPLDQTGGNVVPVSYISLT
jgi:hypothetical protein